MTGNQPHIAGTIVDTLLHIGSRVLEVSEDCAVTNSWNRPDPEPEIKEIYNDLLVRLYAKEIRNCFSDRKPRTIEYNISTDSATTKYNLRLLPAHPQAGYLFLVVEYISTKIKEKVTDGFWEMALDAAGDGMWNVSVAEERISFSDRWHTVFGYNKEK